MSAYITFLIIVFLTAAPLAIVLWIATKLIKRVVIYEFQQGLIYRNGRLARIAPSGAYIVPAWNTAVTIIDTRPQLLIVSGQEVLTTDNVSVKASLAAIYAVADARKATLAAQSYRDELYLALQLALRDAITTRSLADLTAQRATIGNEILANVTPAAERLGLKLSMVELRDIVLPADLRRAFAQVAIARQEGLAALERARGEQAALRALANAARMIEQNPHLFHLRALQAIGERGNVIVHTGTASGPIDTQAIPEN